MENEYYDMTAELDAKEILRYLNDLGIQNISGEVLKYFITDLKKFIKYDLQKKKSSDTQKFEAQGPERLHSASTFSSRIRSKGQEGIVMNCTRDCKRSRPTLPVRITYSAPNLGVQKVEEAPMRRACSCVRIEKKVESVSNARTVSSSYNLIKVPIQAIKKKNDPVSLYHHYTSLWTKYKPNLPGENDWADLRWNMRQKMAMAGSVDSKPQTKITAVKKP